MSMDITIMDNGGLYRLMAWLSPSYPVGAFAYSHGIEWAVEEARVKDEATLLGWIESIVAVGAGWSDAVLFAHAYDAAGNTGALIEINDLATALAPSKERHLETTAQGAAFVKATTDAWPWPDCRELYAALGTEIAYPVAVAAAARGHDINREQALHAYLHGFAANLVSAGVRLIPLGQSAGQRILAKLESVIDATASSATTAEIDDAGSIAILSEIAAMRHETQYTRLFRS
ncbi:MAG: urease accessory protein UreF [Rhodospirillales bacterium]